MLSKEEIRHHFHDAIKKIAETEEVTIADDEIFDDYGLDSLDQMNLLLEMEERVGHDLGELDLSVHNTFDLLYKRITQ
ncbi:MAG: acyl carrier protein [Candidatus Electrothrix sp. Rat3]|nr:acyl carrier protein [Candidatus Electrothrix rattekaaiensis]